MAHILPSKGKWASLIEFEAVKAGTSTGFVNVVGGAKTIQLVARQSSPVPCRKPTLPWGCTDLETFRGPKVKGNLTFAVQMTPEIWDSFHDLDLNFEKFLIANAKKLFPPKDADFILRDNSAISLKYPKPLARYNADGTPDYNSLLRLRISGRGGEVKSFDIKEGAGEGSYATNVVYKDQTEPLTYGATRMIMVTGETSHGSKTVATLIRRSGPLAPGEHKMRHVGPGDMRDGVVVSLTFKINYWTVVNQSTASINLRADEIIFENKDTVVPLPQGFVLANESEGASPSSKPEFLEPLPVKRPRFEHSSSSSFKPMSTQVKDPRKIGVESVSADLSGVGDATELAIHGFPDEFPSCDGCKSNSSGQKAHMGPGGCLYEEE